MFYNTHDLKRTPNSRCVLHSAFQDAANMTPPSRTTFWIDLVGDVALAVAYGCIGRVWIVIVIIIIIGMAMAR